MNRKLKVKLARLTHKESCAHIRARLKRELHKLAGAGRAYNLFSQGNGY